MYKYFSIFCIIYMLADLQKPVMDEYEYNKFLDRLELADSCRNFCDPIPPPGKNLFSTETYLGNWYEETVRNTIKRDDFIRRRDCEQLAVQKSQQMVDLLLKPVKECISDKDCKSQGQRLVQIVFPGHDLGAALKANSPVKLSCQNNHLALSCSVPIERIDYAPYLSTDSVITASPHLFPCTRNTFIVEKPEGGVVADIFYGEPFRLRSIPTQHFDLYLFAAPSLGSNSLSTFSAKSKVRLSDVKTQDTLWRVMPLSPEDIWKMKLGIPVPARKRVQIQHAISGNNLSIELNHPIRTYFGCEYEVTVHTKWDTRKRVSLENHWYLDDHRETVDLSALKADQDEEDTYGNLGTECASKEIKKDIPQPENICGQPSPSTRVIKVEAPEKQCDCQQELLEDHEYEYRPMEKPVCSLNPHISKKNEPMCQAKRKVFRMEAEDEEEKQTDLRALDFSHENARGLIAAKSKDYPNRKWDCREGPACFTSPEARQRFLCNLKKQKDLLKPTPTKEVDKTEQTSRQCKVVTKGLTKNLIR